MGCLRCTILSQNSSQRIINCSQFLEGSLIDRHFPQLLRGTGIYPRHAGCISYLLHPGEESYQWKMEPFEDVSSLSPIEKCGFSIAMLVYERG